MLFDQARKAMFFILKKSRALHLTVDIQLDLFNKMVMPILLYGCEVWGIGNNDIIDKLHVQYCKYVLLLKNSTPTCMVLGELGAIPPSVIIKSRILNFWNKLITNSTPKLSFDVYKYMYNQYNNRYLQISLAEWSLPVT